VFRLNLAVARERFEQLFGFRPADFPAHEDAFEPKIVTSTRGERTGARDGRCRLDGASMTG
jgi:hypothetical protein